jgi:hypothetical protein
MSELSGATTLSTISQTPFSLEMPLSRAAFSTTIPIGNYATMIGGQFGIYDMENEFQKFNQQYGHSLFKSIYEDLMQTMQNMVGKTKMNLTDKTREKIGDKLNKFKAAEENLMNSLSSLIQKNRLYQASMGTINPYVDNPSDYEAILAKHSNLLQLDASFKRKATDLINIFQLIQETMANKFESSTEPVAKDRPMTMGFHYPKKS